MNPKLELPPKWLVLTAALLLMATSLTIHAHPYASGITGTNGAGFVSFIMNEDGATVTVTFEDLTSTNLGVLPKGMTNFYLGTHTSFQISCYKQGSGSPSVISTDTDAFSQWPGNPRGVAVNKNPAIGANFGQLCVGYAGSNFISGAARDRGLYLLSTRGPNFVSRSGGNSFLHTRWRQRSLANSRQQ